MTPDKTADAIDRLGTVAHVWVEGDHGVWMTTLVWGGAGAFKGRGNSLETAYRNMLQAIIAAGRMQPGLHDLAASVTPGILGLPAECHGCRTMERWLKERVA